MLMWTADFATNVSLQVSHVELSIYYWCSIKYTRRRRDRDHMVVEFTTIYVIRVYHHWWCEFAFPLAWGVQHYVIKCVNDLRQVSGFFGTPVSSTDKPDRHDTTEILLKVALNTIKQTNKLTDTGTSTI